MMKDISEAESPLTKRLGANITVRRKALGWTQEQLAHRLGVEPETVSRIERGVTAPSLKTLEKLGGILSIRIADLLQEVSPPPPDGATAVAAWLATLSEKDKAFAMDCLRRLCAHLADRDAEPDTESPVSVGN